MTPDAIGPLLAMQKATSIHDAHEHAVDAVKAGATGDEVRQAITEWMSMQARQVQSVVSAPIRCRCTHGASVHVGGYGQCFQHPCGCDRYADPDVAAAMDRHPAGKAIPEVPQTADIQDYLRQKGEIQ